MTREACSRDEIALSVIVPVYNVAPYLEECLQSLRRQTFTHPYEVILVDDCSTDASADLCQRFIEAHGPGFELLRQPCNLGVSAARNRALERMSGRYFMFVDPDDVLPLDALATLHAAAEAEQVAIVKGNNTIFSESSEKQARYNVSKSLTLHGEAILTTLYQHEKVRGHAGGKLFRSKELAKFRFPVGVSMVEDLLYCCEVFASADSLLLLNQPVYRYRYRESGATGLKFANGSYIDWLDTVEKSGQFCRSPRHVRAYRGLLFRTMTQLARECRRLPPELARQVLPVIEERRARWNIGLRAVVAQKLGLRAFAHLLKLQRAIGQVKRALA